VNYQAIRVDDQEAVRIIRLDRPHALNACNHQLWRELESVLAASARDDAVRAVLLTGEGRAFCVGADLKETVWENEGKGASRGRIDAAQQQLTRNIIGCSVPVVAAINGYALGGGLELAIACDYRFAARGALLGFPEAMVGSFISGGASVILPRLVGPSQAKRLLFRAKNIDAEEAARIGLVDKVVSPDALIAEALRFCLDIAENAPLSVALMKTAINRLCFDQLETALALETHSLLAVYGTDDHKEGPIAFKEKRKPNFRGR
jgi:enoyl-CoA hydratase